MKVAAVIPAYNAGAPLAEVVRRTASEVGPENVIVVDDGSDDDSCAPDRLRGVTCITHRANLGKGAALRTGFREALERDVEAVVTLDADGQHDPAHIRDLVEEAESSDGDIVIGSRMANVGRMPWLRRLTNRTTSYLVSRLAGQRIEDSQSGFRLVRTRALKVLELKTEHYETESEMLIQAGQRGLRILSAPIPSIYGEERSSIRPLADTCRFAWLVIRSAFVRNHTARPTSG